MTFQTPRLNIRELRPDDTAAVHELHALSETDQFNTLGIPDNIETTRLIVNEWVAVAACRPQMAYTFCMEHGFTKQFIGLMALTLGKPKFSIGEVWYKTHVAQWGKGYTTEGLLALLDFAFSTLHLHRVEAGCAVGNVASQKVLEKAGFTREGLKRKILPLKDGWSDAFFFSILEEEFTAPTQNDNLKSS